MHITVNNYFNTTSAAYRQNFPPKLCKTDSEGTLRFNRELIEAESANLSSFVGKVYTTAGAEKSRQKAAFGGNEKMFKQYG